MNRCIFSKTTQEPKCLMEPKIELDEHQTNDIFLRAVCNINLFLFSFISFIACAAKFEIDKSSIRTHMSAAHTFILFIKKFIIRCVKFPSICISRKTNNIECSLLCSLHGVCGMTFRKSNADMWHINSFISMNLTLINTVMKEFTHHLPYVPQTRR